MASKDKKKRKSANVSSNINVTPMVDVMLVLLIIFMVITPMLQKGRSVDLAQTNNPIQMPDADKEDALVVAITHNGDIFFGDDKIPEPEELTPKVKDRLSNRPEKRIFIKADAYTKYKNVVEVVDAVRAAGVDQIGLLTERRKLGSFAGGGQ
jgi:biopolymer transport protein ExbD/biopolymer transport protein TolR